MKTYPLRLILFLFGFFSFVAVKVSVAQTTIDCTNPSITYDMIAANAKVGGNPTNWGTFGATPFAWESASSPSLNANATAIAGHSGVPNRTNVFYGSNSNTPADLISNQIFNLYRGPITLIGTFLNLSTSTQYDESYLTLIPSTYTNRNPVGRSGATGTNIPIGISIGGSVNGSNLFIYDNGDATHASSTITSAARPAAMTTNTWYTLSATFDIQNGGIVITDVSVNGTSVGFTYPVIVASSYYPNQGASYQTRTWVNSCRAVASVDDLLDDFTITTNSCYSISGTVYNDTNGLGDATVNGTGINNPGGSALTAELVDENEVIVDKIFIGAGGTYSFSNVPSGLFEVRLTDRTVGAIGSAATASSLPDGWINTGENIGAGAGDDGSPNGSIIVGTSGATNVNFGIQTHTATSYTFDCNSNVITFDMVSGNAKISNQSNQSATGTSNPTNWATVTNNFEWEAFGTDANLYGTAAAIPQHADLAGADNPTNVFFGGVWQNINRDNTGQVSADFISKQTFSLSSTSGPITLEGKFLNKSGFTEENESYLFIVPDNYTHFQPFGRYDPPGFGSTNQRQGIWVGGNITTSLFIVNNMDASTGSSTISSRPTGWDGLAPAVNTWWTLSATFDVQGSNLYVTDVKVNGSTASFSYPVLIGTVAANSWINNFRVAASADDLMDDITIATNPCISGNVFYDANGMGDGMVNGNGINTASGSQLYIILVDGGGNVVYSVPVASDGTYLITNVYPGSYSVRLSISAGVIGNPAPAASLPPLWTYTGENIGSGSGSDGTANGVMLSVTPAAGTRITGASPVSTASTGVLINFGIQYSTLPVTLVSFTAAKQDKIVLLNWVTVTEMDNDHFVIERSRDGINWQTINQVPTKGNGNNLQYYTDKDIAPLPGINFYRLKQVDIDGKFTFSNVVTINMSQHESKTNLVVAPNPVINNTVIIHLLSNETPRNSKIYLFDTNGKLQKTYSWLLAKGANQITITGISKLASGIYYITVKDDNGNIIGYSSLIK